MRVFLTGATGFVGGHLLRALAARGDRVRCLVRPGSDRRNLAGLDVAPVEGDLSDGRLLERGAAGCEELYHCAADYRLYVPDPPAMYRANVEGTRNVLRAAGEAGIARVIYTSTVGALGLEPGDVPADEETPVSLAEMTGHYKRSKYLAERVADEHAERGLPVVIVNPSTPVGDADLKPTPTGRIIVDFLRRRMPARVDTGLNLVDVRDVAAGHLLAAERGRPGRHYILGNRNMTLDEILAVLSDLTGLPAPRLELPHWLTVAVAAADTARARLTGGEPVIPLDSARLARHKMFFDPGRAVRELSLPQTPVEEALERAVAWFRDNGYAP